MSHIEVSELSNVYVNVVADAVWHIKDMNINNAYADIVKLFFGI